MADDVRIIIDADARQVVVEAGKARTAIRGLGDETRRQTASGAAFSAAGRRQVQTLHELGTAARRTSIALVALGTSGIAHLIRTGAQFEKRMSAVNAVTNATAEQLEQLRKAALAAGAATRYSAGEAAQAQEELAKGGLSVANILQGGLDSALSLAAAGELELAEAASITANAMNLFRLEGRESTKVADALATAANQTTADVSDFGMALAQSGAVAKSAGLDFTETMVVLEALAAAGVKNSDAGTSLKTALIQLIKPTEKQAELSKKLGLSFVGANGEMRSMSDISGMLREKLKGQGDAQRTATLATLAGTDGVRTLTALYDAGPAKLDRYSAALGKTGTAADVARKKQDNVAGAFEQLTGSIETVEAALFHQFQEPLKDALLDATREVNTKGKEVEAFFDRVFDMPEFQSADLAGKLRILLDEFDKTGLPDRMRDLIVEGFTKGLDAALPVVIEGAKDLAVAGAKAFGKAFIDADPLSRLLMTGYLLHKTGALAAFRAYGKTAGATVAASAATGAAAAPVAAGWKQTGKKWGAAAGKAGGLAMVVAFLPEAVKGISDGLKKQGGEFKLPKNLSIGNSPLGLPDALSITTPINNVLARLDGVDDKLADFGVNAQKAFKSLSAEGNARGLAELADQARRMATEFPKASKELLAFAGAADRAGGTAQDQFALMRASAGKNFAGIKQVLADTSFEIAQRFGPDTEKGKQALARNFREAAQAIKVSMKAGRISVKQGMAEIERLVTASLRSYGLSPKAAKAEFDRQEYETESGQGTGGRARGGLIQIGQPGAVAHDDVPAVLNGKRAVVAEGEQIAVFNRHQQAELNQRLADTGGLPGFFARNNRPHYMAKGGVFAKGGIVPIPGQPGESIAASILPSVMKLIDRYSLKITDGLGSSPPHAPNSDHLWGGAIDAVPAGGAYGSAAGNWEKVDALAKWAEPSQGHPRPPFRWVGYDGDSGHGRGSHIHLSWMRGKTGLPGGIGKGAGGGAGGGDMETLKRVMMRGDLGAISALGQRTLDVTRKVAQNRLNALAASSGGSSGGGGVESGQFVPGSTSIKALDRTFPRHIGPKKGAARLSPETIVKLAQSVGLPGRGAEQIAHGESDYYPGIQQPDPGDGMVGYGLMQNTPNAWGKGSAALKHMQRLGGIPAMFNPVKNMMQAKYLYDAAGKSWSPWYGTKYLNRPAGSRPGARGLLLAAGGMTPRASGVVGGSKTGSQTTVKKGKTPKKTKTHGYKPGKYKHKLKDVPGLAEFERLGVKVDENEQAIQNTIRIHDLTDEEQGASADIKRRTGEIDQLIALKALSAKWLAAQQKEAKKALDKLQEGIKERLARVNRVKRIAKTNMGRIRALTKLLGKAKGPEKKRIARRIDALRDENERLIGSRSVKADLEGGAGGLLETTRKGLGAWQDERDRITPDVKTSVQALFDTGIDIEELRKERKEWTGSSGAGNVPKPDSELLELTRAQLAEEKQRTRMLSQQFDVFKGFSPLLDMRVQGSYMRGIKNVPFNQLAELHEGETVLPSPKGPYGSQVAGLRPANVQVTLFVEGDAAPLMKRVRAEVDGRAARVVSEQLGRRSRLITSAPGGVR